MPSVIQTAHDNATVEQRTTARTAASISDITATTNITTFTLANKSTDSIFISDGSWTSNLGDYGHLQCMEKKMRQGEV